ncbi:MAG: nuclear transport factor 2 family protein [Pseudomonadota bacterium]
MIDTMAVWHDIYQTRDASKLGSILAEDAVMISPVVHTHQRGKKITQLYLTAALSVFANEHFRYVRKTSDENGVIMEFETEIDGVFINGVDMVTWNEEGLITEFKVMLRPLQAVNMIHQKMGEMLEKIAG